MQAFLARQPVFDKDQNVYAYELLYRSGLTNNFYGDADGDYATSSVITNGFLSIGMEAITRGKMAFINFTRNLLLREIATVFPKELMGVEILEDVEPDAEIVATCKKLKQADYTLILDDFVLRPEFTPLLEWVDIIKIDFITTDPETRSSVIQQVNSKRIKFLAEKVETRAEFKEAVEMGYTYFQGYFFAKPEIIAGQAIPATKMNFLRLLQQVNQPELDFDKLEKIFKEDVTLTYKMLRYINSTYFGFPNRIRSVRHALNLIGMKEAQKWLSLIAMSSMGADKSEELVLTSLSRANLSELLAPLVGLKERSSEFFLMGLFSLLDAFLDQPLPDILEQLPISDDIKNALVGRQGLLGEVLKLVISYEMGDWNQVFACVSKLKSVENELPDLFIKTLERTNQILPGQRLAD